MAEVMRTKHEQQQKQQEKKPTHKIGYSPYRAGYGAFSGR